VGDFDGWGFGVFSGSGDCRGFIGDLPGLDFPPLFFFAFLDFEDGEGVFVGLADGVFRGVLCSSSSLSLAVKGDLVVFAGDFFGFAVLDSSGSDLRLEGVFAGFAAVAFFFFGEAVGVGEADLW
jgi:hypothetical protein